MEPTTRLHYLYDPLCGWCYAAAPLVRAARDSGLVSLTLHGGGMITGARRRPMTPDFRELIRLHEQRMQALTGQPFGAAYIEGLLRDASVVYDSEPPTIAILVADQLGRRGADMYAAIQQAHYVQGRKIGDRTVLASLAAELGFGAESFSAQWAIEASRVQAHFEQSAEWLRRMGGQGFPTFALEQGERLVHIDHSLWYGKPGAFIEALKSALDTTAA